MTSFCADGITIKFPFEPYSIQKNYMQKVVECLETSSNGILESPTGTGKTLSLLCSSLAWLESKKKTMHINRRSDPDLLSELETLHPDMNKKEMNKIFGVPTIIYASRTHSQLSQAMSELKRTEYKYMEASILGSRDQLCIDNEVSNETNFQNKINMCNLKVKTRTCKYYLGFEKLKNKGSRLFDNSVVDIEDLITMGKKNTCCPYFMSKDMTSSSDITFMPYNYVLEPRYQKALGISLMGNVIILDEAHNVEKLCQESASTQIRTLDISMCIEDVTAAMKLFNDGDDLTDEAPKDFSPEDLCSLKELLLKLEKSIDEIPLEKNEATFDGTYIFELLESCEIRIDNSPILINLLSKIAQYLAMAQSEGPFQRKGAALDTLEQFLSIVFMGNTENKQTFMKSIHKCYKVYVKLEESKNTESKAFWTPKSKTAGRVINYWCFNPGFGMKMLMAQGVHCVILTSGTLAPLPPLISELELRNTITLENTHVIKSEQVFVSVITAGPDNETLICNYNNRTNMKYIISLGITINNIVRVSPGGVLIFFPSYPILTAFQDVWQSKGIWSGMNSVKTVYVEPKDKVSFQRTMTEYYSTISDKNSNGAVFMGVCRGKISEGLDFADENGRTVIMIGLPYPPLLDPKVVLKKKYMDICNSKHSEYPSGNKWYTLEALRAVNQAIGRVIRHSKDYGAIMLLDTRYKQEYLQEHLSKWLRNRIKIQSNFATINKDLRLFFKNAEQMKFNCGIDSLTCNSTPTVSCINEGLVLNDISSVSSASEPLHNEATASAQDSSSDSINPIKRKRTLIGTVFKVQTITLKPDPTIKKFKIVKNKTKQPITVGMETADYILIVKKALHSELFKLFVSYLQTYKEKKDFNEFVTNLDNIFLKRHDLRYLLQGVERYVDKTHKELFQSYWEKMKL